MRQDFVVEIHARVSTNGYPDAKDVLAVLTGRRPAGRL